MTHACQCFCPLSYFMASVHSAWRQGERANGKCRGEKIWIRHWPQQWQQKDHKCLGPCPTVCKSFCHLISTNPLIHFTAVLIRWQVWVSWDDTCHFHGMTHVIFMGWHISLCFPLDDISLHFFLFFYFWHILKLYHGYLV